MSVSVSHRFVSAKSDSTDATLINPSNWNATHVVTDSTPTVVMTDYNFTAQQPGGSLIVGSNNITLNPIPSGIAIGNKLYISGGVGTAEPVAITGWNGTTGAVIVTCAYTHSGAWTIKSASAGLQEAIVYLYATFNGGKVWIPGSIYTLLGTINLYNGIHLEGCGTYESILRRTADYGDTFKAIQKDNLFFTNFKVQQYINYVAGTPGTVINAPTTGSHFNLLGCNTVHFKGVRFESMPSNVSITGGAEIHFNHCQWYGIYDQRVGSPQISTFGLVIQPYNATYGIATYIHLYECFFGGDSNGTVNSYTNYNGVGPAYGIAIYNVEDFEMVGGFMGGANLSNFSIFPNATSFLLSNIRLLGVRFDSCGGNADINIQGDSTGTVSVVNAIVDGCIFNGELAGHSALYIQDQTVSNPAVLGFVISNCIAYAYYDSCFNFGDGKGIVCRDNLLYYYNLHGNTGGNSAAIYVNGRCTKYVLSGNLIGGGSDFRDYDNVVNKCLQGIFVTTFGTTNAGVIKGNSTPTQASISTQSDLVFLNQAATSTFANLPPTPTLGCYATITDSNTVTWGAVAAGGGANKVLVFYNGANWTVAGK